MPPHGGQSPNPKAGASGGRQPRPPSSKSPNAGPRPSSKDKHSDREGGGGRGAAWTDGASGTSPAKRAERFPNTEIKIPRPDVKKSGFVPPSPRGMQKFMKMYYVDQDVTGGGIGTFSPKQECACRMSYAEGCARIVGRR